MCSPSLIDRGKPASAAPCQRLPPALAGLRTLFAFEPRLAPFAESALAFLEILAAAHLVEHSGHFGNRLERPSRYDLAPRPAVHCPLSWPPFPGPARHAGPSARVR